MIVVKFPARRIPRKLKKQIKAALPYYKGGGYGTYKAFISINNSNACQMGYIGWHVIHKLKP